MITFEIDYCNTFTQEIYDNSIEKLNFGKIKCKKCGQTGCFAIHGYYSRWLKQFNKNVEITIMRIKCKECNCTHALLPGFIVPYMQPDLYLQKEIIVSEGNSEATEQIMNDNISIDETIINRIRRNYKHHWLERLHSIFKSISSSLTVLTQKCIQHFKKQFMQIHRGQNLFFQETT